MARRKYDGQQCQAKGILKNNGRYICKLHGGMSYGQRTVEGRIKALMNLRQYKNKSYEEIKRSIETIN